MKKKIIALVASLALVASVGAGATLAYLTDTTETVTNTFTVGNVDITLTETSPEGTVASVSMVTGTSTSTGYAYDDLLPGDIVSKKPVVTVIKDSEDCYVFVKVTNNDRNLTIGAIAQGWTEYKSENNGATKVYYRVAEKNEKVDQAFTVFESVSVSTSIEEGGDLNNISIKASAVQYKNVANVDAAYAMAFAEKANN